MTEQHGWSDMVRGALPPTTRSEPPEPPPAAGGRRERTPREARWHAVEIDTTELSGHHFWRKVEGDDVWVASALRALANQLDPPPLPVVPKKLTRGTESAWREAGSSPVLLCPNCSHRADVHKLDRQECGSVTVDIGGNCCCRLSPTQVGLLYLEG